MIQWIDKRWQTIAHLPDPSPPIVSNDVHRPEFDDINLIRWRQNVYTQISNELKMRAPVSRIFKRLEMRHQKPKIFLRFFLGRGYIWLEVNDKTALFSLSFLLFSRNPFKAVFDLAVQSSKSTTWYIQAQLSDKLAKQPHRKPQHCNLEAVGLSTRQSVYFNGMHSCHQFSVLSARFVVCGCETEQWKLMWTSNNRRTSFTDLIFTSPGGILFKMDCANVFAKFRCREICIVVTTWISNKSLVLIMVLKVLVLALRVESLVVVLVLRAESLAFPWSQSMAWTIKYCGTAQPL